MNALPCFMLQCSVSNVLWIYVAVFSVERFVDFFKKRKILYSLSEGRKLSCSNIFLWEKTWNKTYASQP
jgi:hypothetical protein